ncbi:MAG: PD-(D/E)XK nuclease family protein, partial [Chromatiales bacterium]
MLAADPSAFPAFLCSGGAHDFTWALQTGDILQQLRADLVEGGLLLRDVVRLHAADLEELERWRDMAALEEHYLAQLHGLGLLDPHAARIGHADRIEAPPNVTRLVVACAPDLSLPATQTIERLGADLHVDILVAAPADHAALFDMWGRPLPEAWQAVRFDPDDPQEDLVLAGSPQGQCQAVIDRIATDPSMPAPDDIAIGVPDPSVIPFMLSTLADNGIEAFDPSDKPLRDHSLCHLLVLLCGLVTERSYRTFSRFIRHPDALQYLTRVPSQLLVELDEFQHTFLPLTFDSMSARLHDERGGTLNAASFPAVHAAVAATAALLHGFEQQPFAEAMRTFLQACFDARTLEAGQAQDDEFSQAARLVDAALHEIESAPFTSFRLSSAQTAQLFAKRLGEQSYHRERAAEGIDLLGWLELVWTDAPCLFVTGMNEGQVPDSRIGDSFMPDSLRSRLGLTCDATRLARDTFLMRICIESRRRAGRACFIAGKTSTEGDPLKPSRLLFRCSDADLPRRAALFFGDVETSRPMLPASITFRLTPPAGVSAVEQRDMEGEAVPSRGACRSLSTVPLPAKLSVTAFSSYLACPFRFYLSNILGMQEADDSKRDLDALDFGSIVHELLEDMAGRPELVTCSDPERLAAYLVAGARTLFEQRFGGELAAPLLVSLDADCERLKAVARVQTALIDEGWEISANEQKLQMEIGGIVVRGKLDRIDRHKSTGRL